MSCDVGEVTGRLKNEPCYDYNYELCSFSNTSVALPTSQLILQSSFRFSYVTNSSLNSPFTWQAGLPCRAHSPTFTVTSPTSRLILQPLHRFTYFTAHSPTLLSLLLRRRLLILQAFRRFTYVTDHSPTLLTLHLRLSSFSKPSIASPTSQALPLRHLASRPCHMYLFFSFIHCYLETLQHLWSYRV